MNCFDNIIYEQEQGLIDVAMSQLDYLYKEYCLLDYGIYEESVRQIDMSKRAKNDPLLGELLRTSKDALSMVKYFHAFSIIGSDTVKLLAIAVSGNKPSEDKTKEKGD